MAVGDGVTSVSVGDKVVIGWPWCGSCRNCLDGQPRYCLQLGPLVIAGARADGSTSLRRLDGSPLHSHFFGQSSFASYSICAASALVKVPDDADVSILGPLACGISTGAGAVLNALRPFAGSSIVVYGSGAVGLSAIMASRLTAATHIIAVDKLASRLALAAELGATETIDVSVDRRGPGRGGPGDLRRPRGLQHGLRGERQRAAAGRRLGRHAGHGRADRRRARRRVVLARPHVHPVGQEGRRHPRRRGPVATSLINTLITLNAQGRFPYDRLIEKFPLDQVNEALEASHHGDVIKPVLTMPVGRVVTA